MDYEQKYKEALERARNLHKDAIDMEESLLAKQCEIIFPELKESGDEKIRRELIAYFRNNSVYIKWSRLDVKKAIEWLEKQGKQKYTQRDVDDAYLKGICDAKQELEKQGEQKPQGKTALEALKEKEINNANCATPKTKPKFHKGDWIINPETGNVLQIKNVLLCGNIGNYEFDNNSMPIESVDKHYKKFKVKYAGSEYNVFEVKDIDGVTFYGIEDEPNHIDYVQAANCERVDGYNIKENGSPFPIKPTKFSKETSAWSEEDESFIKDLLDYFGHLVPLKHEMNDVVDWLESLKDKITWKPSDE